MRNLLLRLVLLAGVALTLEACADSPVQSEQQRGPDLATSTRDEELAPEGCVVGGVCLLPPISGGWCEPWMELDWDCDEGGGECLSSAGPTDPTDATVQSCPGGGDSGGGLGDGGGGDGNGDPGENCIEEVTSPCEPDAEESTICPQPFYGNVQPALITVAGRNHEFQFHSSETKPFTRLTGGTSPATYKIGLPTISRDDWWIAESGTITVWCRGVWIRQGFWLGTLTVVDSDLHMVMGPGHPDF
jgi:hypothetical protein